MYRARSRGQDRSWREAPLTDPKHAVTAPISRYGREGISYPLEEARKALAAVNPEVQIVPLAQRVAGSDVDRLVAAADVVLDCSDNFATRHALNRACVKHRKRAAHRRDAGARGGETAGRRGRDAARPIDADRREDFGTAQRAGEERSRLRGVRGAYVFMILRPALRLLTRPRPPADLAARFLAAVIRPPLLFFMVVTPSLSNITRKSGDAGD